MDANVMLVDATPAQLEVQQQHLRKNSMSPPMPSGSGLHATLDIDTTTTNNHKQQLHSLLPTNTSSAASTTANSGQTPNSNCSSAGASPSKLMLGGGVGSGVNAALFHHHNNQHLQHQHHHHHHHNSGHAHTLHTLHQHPAIVNLKQCAAGGGGMTGVCCNLSGCSLSGSSTPTPPQQALHHTLYPLLVSGVGSSGPSSLVNSPAMGRRKRYTSTSSNCSSQFNNNYAGLDMESLEDMLRKVNIFELYGTLHTFA
ncbi:uncharacterized protein CG43867-like [Bactrocera tryoni]|uniref:uncharacterized protein CG43867-like n=1 Tax=Bactrocera tryoni TaxID=59916 RepID=UPI001A986828|nr:uncharacterized protein CG43867-like [Bactrocera tryoni]